MNMPPPVGSKPFREHMKAIRWAAKDVAEQTIKDAAQKSTTPRMRTVKTLWKLLFHAMDHGKEGDLPRRTDVHVTVISMENGKMLDVEPLSKVSKACKKHASFQHL
jgi:hypothetical protein